MVLHAEERALKVVGDGPHRVQRRVEEDDVVDAASSGRTLDHLAQVDNRVAAALDAERAGERKVDQLAVGIEQPARLERAVDARTRPVLCRGGQRQQHGAYDKRRQAKPHRFTFLNRSST
ncbi:MAG TPA: hypothetical protein VGD62_04585 [Acidobacteriaceae bacterium]